MSRILKKFPGDTIVYFISFSGFLLLSGIVCLFPVGFTEYRNTDTFAPFWYMITITGGVYGSAAIITALTFYLLFKFKNNPEKKKPVIFFTGIILLLQILISGSTLYYFKDVFGSPRPSQLYITEKVLSDKSSNEFLTMPPEEKSPYLRKKIEDNKSAFKDVYPPILRSWSDESGFSFPSGHSETSFFLGTILSYIIFKTGSKKYYSILPVIWAVLVAVSRVVIGVHFPSDVVAGAAIGMIFGSIVISFKSTKVIFN